MEKYGPRNPDHLRENTILITCGAFCLESHHEVCLGFLYLEVLWTFIFSQGKQVQALDPAPTF